jgi:hypothetical protein
MDFWVGERRFFSVYRGPGVPGTFHSSDSEAWTDPVTEDARRECQSAALVCDNGSHPVAIVSDKIQR